MRAQLTYELLSSKLREGSHFTSLFLRFDSSIQIGYDMTLVQPVMKFSQIQIERYIVEIEKKTSHSEKE